jgi:CheY-like chemotaxis protein
LVVDDNAAVRHALRRLVERAGAWTVCGEAEDGEVAVQKVKELRPDLVILDFQMPVMDGLEAAREIAYIATSTASAEGNRNFMPEVKGRPPAATRLPRDFS